MFGIRWMFENIGASFGQLLTQNMEERVMKGKHDNSLKPITDTLEAKVVGDREKENKKRARRAHVTTRDSNIILHTHLYTSTIRFFE